MALDPLKIRIDFPILDQMIYKRSLVYFDNAATTQKPRQVINAIDKYYLLQNSNIHRGVHYLSQMATQAYEDARVHIQHFINARLSQEIIYTRGTTESINLVASSFGKKFISKGDTILVSNLEHHSNIVPWQFVCEEKGAVLKVIPINDEGEILLDAYTEMLDEKVKIVAVTHVSNALGTIVPVKEMIRLAHLKNIPVLIDGAQSVAHFQVDVQDLDADFFCFSGHKMYGPMGIGVLYGKEHWLEDLPPYQGGGEMIKDVTFEKTTYNDLPFKFEAGTPNVCDALGLDAALTYMQNLGLSEIYGYEEELLHFATARLLEIEGLKIIGTSPQKAGVISFLPDGIHPYDLGTILDKLGFALRTGNHCAQPLMHRLGIQGTLRASFAFYNTKEEINRLAEGIITAKRMFD
ncbi:MAG: cysteine desulfurase [Bacteroidetes bacterium]|nr:cysteine desulfurase [Bacteroidota bacterium]